jgi:hypothetical protein
MGAAKQCLGGCGREALMDDGWCLYGPAFCNVRTRQIQRDTDAPKPTRFEQLVARLRARWRAWRWWRDD